MSELKFNFKYGENEITLRDGVELFALGICEDISDGRKRTNEIMRKCKILDSLSGALRAISA